VKERAKEAKVATRAETRTKKLVLTVRNPFAPMAPSKRRRFHALKRPSPYVLTVPFSRERRKSRRSLLVLMVKDPNVLMGQRRRRRSAVPRKLSPSVLTAPSSREDLVRREKRLLPLPPKT